MNCCFLRVLLLLSGWVLMEGFAQGPQVRIPGAQTSPSQSYRYPWHLGTTATIFWVGEKPTERNPTPNHKSSWDVKWQENYGGYDNPDPAARDGFLPKGFIPKLNPFYITLPYNDLIDHRRHKPEASEVIPWFRRYSPVPGQSVCHGRWVQIVRNKRVCYAQWEDCGPFRTDDWKYVFRNEAPLNKKNRGAGIDISPAVRDFLKIRSGQKVHWRFVEFQDIPRGPWSLYGKNNPFVNIYARR